jgi:hypothetical protein
VCQEETMESFGTFFQGFKNRVDTVEGKHN